jgi:hypothetical protein
LVQLAEMQGLDSSSLWRSGEICRRVFRKGEFAYSSLRASDTWPDCVADDNDELTRDERETVRVADAVFHRLLARLDTKEQAAEPVKPDVNDPNLADFIDKCGPKRREFLRYLHDDGRRTQRKIAEATRHVYGNDNEDNRSKLNDLKKEANKQLAERGLPFEISTKGETIALRKTDGEITGEK